MSKTKLLYLFSAIQNVALSPFNTTKAHHHHHHDTYDTTLGQFKFSVSPKWTVFVRAVSGLPNGQPHVWLPPTLLFFFGSLSYGKVCLNLFLKFCLKINLRAKNV